MITNAGPKNLVVGKRPRYGTLTIAGRKFQYTILEEEDGFEGVTSMADKLKERHPNLSNDILNHVSDIKRYNDAMLNTEKKILSAIRKYIHAKETVVGGPSDGLRAESGISQRLIRDFKFEEIQEASGGLIVKEINGDAYVDDEDGSKTITRREENKVVQTYETVTKDTASLVSDMNRHLIQLLGNRRTANRGVNQDILFDGSTVDLKIPTPDSNKPIGEQLHDLAIYLSGSGDSGTQFAQEMTRLNRFAKSFLPGPRELVGYTFITRPHCNLSQQNLANCPQFAPLMFADDNSIQMALRCSLDTTMFEKLKKVGKVCDLIDDNNPFLVCACNALKSINGFPDPQLGVETSEGGFFSEQQTSVIGTDRLAHGQDLQLTFRDYIGGPIMALHDYWQQYMGNLGDGSMSQYTDDIEANLMGYTVSIYRFVTDPSGRQITRWAKATGCFPKGVPTGTVFNINESERVVSAAREFSIPYWAHHFGYNDPRILKEFNMLVGKSRYYKALIDSAEPKIDEKTGRFIQPIPPVIRGDIINNRAGIPHITQRNGFIELEWLVCPYHVERTPIDYDDREANGKQVFFKTRPNIGPRGNLIPDEV